LRPGTTCPRKRLPGGLGVKVAVSAGTEKLPVEPIHPQVGELRDRLEALAPMVNRLAHDFNNVLTGVLGFLELAMGGLPAESASGSLVKEAYEAARAGCDHVRQLSLFSRRSQGPVGPVDLAAIAQEEAESRSKSWGTKPLLRLAITSGLPAVRMEPSQARYVMGALLANAFEAMPKGEGVIVISAKTIDLAETGGLDYLGNVQSGTHVEMTIEDNGAGFSAEARRRVFVELFYTSKLQHRGLGLLTTYGILRNAQGGLKIEHLAGGGTRVHVLIRVAQSAASLEPAPESTASLPKAGKVLVVDDDPSIVMVMRRTQEGAGYEVCSAADGDEALLSIDQAAAPFKLVLSDVIMPRMSGFDLADQIHRRQPQVPVLLTSGKLNASFVPNRFASRQYTLLPKPFRPDTLLSAVRSALAGDSDNRQPVTIDNRFEDKSQLPAKDASSSK
jgi:CheY-like chemotaxis protein